MRAIASSLTLFAIGQLSIGCISAISGSGNVVEEERMVDAFTEIAVEGDMDVDVIVGPSTHVMLRYDDNLIDLVRTVTDEDGVLHVRQNEDIAFFDTTAQTVSIEVPSLVAFGATGDVDAELRDIEAQTFEIALTGDSRLVVDGVVTTLDLSSTGDSEIAARGLEAQDVDLTATGSSDITVFARKSIRGTLSGSSHLTVYGDPSSDRISTSGDSTVDFR